MIVIEEAGLFKGISSYVINEIAEIATEQAFSKGDVLFKKGDFADYLYVLGEGEIVVGLQGQTSISIPINQPGQIFGWSALIEPNQYTAMAEVVKDSSVVKIDGDRLMSIFERHPSEGLLVFKRLAGVIASRLVASFQKMTG